MRGYCRSCLTWSFRLLCSLACFCYFVPVGDVVIFRNRVRKLGTTQFARADEYDHVVLSEAQIAEFFREGRTVVRGALRPKLVADLRRVAGDLNDYLMRHQIFNTWMESDEFVDFYVYSNLGSLAAQIFGTQNTESAGHQPPTVYLWRDYIHIRNPGGAFQTGWHTDLGECEGDLPSNYTERARLRVLIPLDDDMPGPVTLNQTAYVQGMSEEEQSRYWLGELPFRIHFRFEYLGNNVALPPLPGVHLVEDTAILKEVRLQQGDVMLLNPCAWHKSPAVTQQTLQLALAYAPGSSRVFTPGSKVLTDPFGSLCDHGLPEGAAIASGSACYLQVYPAEKRPEHGSEISVWKTKGQTLWSGTYEWFDLYKKLPQELQLTEDPREVGMDTVLSSLVLDQATKARNLFQVASDEARPEL